MHFFSSRFPAPCRGAPARGFTLIEVLLAIVMLSLGVLGMAGLQASALQANRDARLQSTALRLAREAAELVRGNPSIAAQAAPADNPFLTTSPPSSGAGGNCFATGCDSARQAAEHAIQEWQAHAQAELPGARAVICHDASPTGADGLPQWACTHTGAVLVVKLGWTRRAAGHAGGSAGAYPLLDRAVRPSVLVALTAGGGA